MHFQVLADGFKFRLSPQLACTSLRVVLGVSFRNYKRLQGKHDPRFVSLDERVTSQNVHFKIHFAQNHFAHLIASLFIDDQYENYLSTPMISEVKRRKMSITLNRESETFKRI